MEIFKMTSKLGIKPKDVIGMGGDIVKMGKSLFNTKVNPKLLEYVNKKGDIPGKILEDIKIHMRSMKNASDNQIELFRLNLKDIFNAKFPPKADVIKMPVSGDKKLDILSKYKETPGEWVRGQTFGTREYYLNELKNAYPKNYRNLTGKETKEELKEIIYRLDTEGVPFSDGGVAKLNAELNQLPEYYLPMADGGIANHFRKK